MQSDDPFEPLFAEILQEKARSLGRAGQELLTALRALREHDHQSQRPAVDDAPDRRDTLVQIASERLWGLIIQREACGLTEHQGTLKYYNVPADVCARMGSMRPPSSAGKQRSGEVFRG